MARAATYDHDEAKRLRAAGVPVREIAERCGVSTNEIYRVTSPGRAERMVVAARSWRQAQCSECGGPATRHYSRGHDASKPRCRDCATKAQATSVRDGELQCVTCRRWKPDHAFPHNRAVADARRGRHQCCRACSTEMKRAWRERNKVPCSHGCGRMVDAKNRRDPNKLHECRPCAARRIAAERHAEVAA